MALAFAVLAYAVLALGKLVSVRVSRRMAETRIGVVHRVAERLAASTRRFPMAVLSLFIGFQWVEAGPAVSLWARTITVFVLVFQAGLWGNALIGLWLERSEERYLEADARRVTTMRAAGFVLRLILFSILIVLALDNIPGVEVTALVASLGIGGIAVALALQNVLADLFASLSISLDKPFVIGDFIIVDNFLGVVDHVGLKTTRIKSLWGEQLVFSNNDLLNSRIRNFGLMAERRVAFTFGVVYQTPADKLERIPGMVREIVEKQSPVRFDRAHFKEYGDFSLVFEIVYYIHDRDYNLYMDIQQAINLAIYRRFEEEGIAFAYPTRTLYVKREEGGAAPGETDSAALPTP